MNAQVHGEGMRPPNKLLRKITPKTITDAIGIDLLTLQRPVKPRHLYDLFGTIRGAQIVPDKSGQGRSDAIKFRGTFVAVADDGAVEFDSAVTYIPVLDDLIFDAWKSAQADNESAVVEVSLSISIVTAPAGKPSATGYEFDVQRIGKVAPRQADDPIARLRAEAAEIRQQLLSAPAAGNGTATGNGAATGDGASHSAEALGVSDVGTPSSETRSKKSSTRNA